ncbi:MAG: helix-turn-helix transcriptional regulator [candidate division NC10 bacterium]|nr:helix-turn-helix transcriptional regulator [candidate division NC10 bacterium]
MVVQFVAPPKTQIAVALNRGRRDFSERDRLLLNLLRPHLIETYQNATIMTRMQRETALLSETLEVSGQGMVALSQEGPVRRMTPRARQWLEAYFGRSSPRATRLPEPLRSWVTHHKAHLDAAADVPAARTPFVSEWDGTRLVVRHLDDAETCHLVLEEQPTARQPASLEPLGLSGREAEVLHWVAEGKTNAEIGSILGVRLRTVKKHLEHIYAKLGVESRTAAATLALRSRLRG